MRQRIINLLRWANIVLILVTFLAYFSPSVDPRNFWFFSIFGLIFPVFFWLHICFIIGWAFLRKWYFLLSLGCLILGYQAVSNFVQFNAEELKASEGNIRLFTNNIMTGRKMGGINESDEVRSKNLVGYLHQQSADIICLQEYLIPENAVKQLDKLLSADYETYHLPKRRLLIASKYPILDKGNTGFINNMNGCIFIDVEIGKQKVRIYNVHLQSNRVTDLADKVAQDGDLQDKETWGNVKEIFGGYKRAAQERAAQASAIAEHIAQSPYPVIVCGDFNDVPQSFAYRRLAKNLQDSFRKKGSGLGTTFAGNLPMLRIDYVLSSLSFDVLSHQVPKSNRSDHYPVVVELGLK